MRQLARRVLAVTVDLDRYVVTLVPGDPETGLNRPSDAEVEREARNPGSRGMGDLSGSVRRTVVDDEHVDGGVRPTDLPDHVGYGCFFIECGDDGEEFHEPGSPLCGRLDENPTRAPRLSPLVLVGLAGARPTVIARRLVEMGSREQTVDTPPPAAGGQLGALVSRLRVSAMRHPIALEVSLVAALVLAAFLYHFLQGMGRPTPWIFPDELRYAEFSRAVAESGTPDVRGEWAIGGVLQSYLLAPAWLLDDTESAWAAVKAINAFLFSLAAVPVYLLARRLADVGMAVLVAASSVVVAAGLYASTMMQEPLAYPIAATAALVTVRLIESFSWRALGVLIAVCVAAVSARGQLAILPFGVAFACVAEVGLARARGVRRDRRLLGLAAGVAAVGVVGLLFVNRDASFWHEIGKVAGNPGSTLDAILAGAVAVAVAVWIVPAVAYLVACTFAGSDDRSRSAFGSVLLGFGAAFLAYAGFKAASVDFAPHATIEERNLIYLEPLSLVALAVVWKGARLRWAVVGAGVVVVALLLAPIERMSISTVLTENPGTSWIHNVSLPEQADSRVLPVLVALAVGGALLVCTRLASGVALSGVFVLLVVCGAVLYGNEHHVSRAFADRLGTEKGWIDVQAGGDTAAVAFSSDTADLSDLWSLAFWNRSIRDVVDVDGGERWGSRVSQSGITTDGGLGVPAARWVLAARSLGVSGRSAGVHQATGYLLTHTAGSPRVFARVLGRYPDSWAGDTLTVTQYLPQAGLLRLNLSTEPAFIDRPRTVSTYLDAQPWSTTIPPGVNRTVELPVPPGPFSLYFKIRPAESPLARGSGPDPRPLSLHVGPVTVPGGSRPI